MNDFFEQTGMMAIGTRMRMLSERITKESEQIFALYNIDIKPKWYPVVFSLLTEETKTVTTLAQEIGHSHVSVIKILKEMSNAGMLVEKKDKHDKRKTNITLSTYRKECIKGLKSQHLDTTIAMQHDLWLALDEFETLNKEWIEQRDIDILENPKEYIIDQGGAILIALYNNEPIGVCALVNLED